MNVVLETRPLAFAVDGNVAVADEKVPLNELQRLARQPRREKQCEIDRAVLPDPPGDDRPRKRLLDGKFYKWVGFVIAQQYVVLWLILFYQIVFEGERFPFGVGHDEFHIFNV